MKNWKSLTAFRREKYYAQAAEKTSQCISAIIWSSPVNLLFNWNFYSNSKLVLAIWTFIDDGFGFGFGWFNVSSNHSRSTWPVIVSLFWKLQLPSNEESN